MTKEQIIKALPYKEPFLFVNELTDVSVDGVTGNYTFKASEPFYKGHFKNHPVTPGVLITECMAQIGLVCLAIFLEQNAEVEDFNIAFTSAQVDFLSPAYPDEKLTVTSQKKYYRFGKLKCNVTCTNPEGTVVAQGALAGMIVKDSI